MKKNGLAGRVRDAVAGQAVGRSFGYKALFKAMDIVDQSEKQPVYRVVNDMVRRGELERVGVDALCRREYEARPAPKTTCMWRFIRASRKESILATDLVSTCGVSEITAKEYLQTLVRRGIMRRIDRPGNKPSLYRMIPANDPGPGLVRDDEKAERLRRIRVAKQEALDLIEASSRDIIEASKKLMDARIRVNDIPIDADDSDA